MSAAEAYLTADGSPGVEVAVRLKTEIAAIETAVASIRMKRPELIRAIHQARAQSLREKANRNRAELQPSRKQDGRFARGDSATRGGRIWSLRAISRHGPGRTRGSGAQDQRFAREADELEGRAREIEVPR